MGRLWDYFLVKGEVEGIDISPKFGAIPPTRRVVLHVLDRTLPRRVMESCANITGDVFVDYARAYPDFGLRCKLKKKDTVSILCGLLHVEQDCGDSIVLAVKKIEAAACLGGCPDASLCKLSPLCKDQRPF